MLHFIHSIYVCCCLLIGIVLENDGQNMAPPKEVSPLADEDASTVPEYKPVDDIPAASPATTQVGADITTSSAQPEAIYAEISTRSAAEL